MEVSKQVRGLNKVDDALLKQNAILRQRIGNFCDVPVQASGGFAHLNSKIELIDSAMQAHFTGQIIWKLAGLRGGVQADCFACATDAVLSAGLYRDEPTQFAGCIQFALMVLMRAWATTCGPARGVGRCCG